MVYEDDIDLEQLQAQIDVSMSFAHNLVTSWIKPSHRASIPSNGTSISQILQEELRRPPRLGVGAPIPLTPTNAQEASELKRKLVRRGAGSESVTEIRPQEPSKSDDDELKGRPAKRKTKVDPFERSKKKRKMNLDTAPPSPIQSNPEDPVSLEKDGGSVGMSRLTDTPSRKEQQRVEYLKPNARQGSLAPSPLVKLLAAPGNTTTSDTTTVHTSPIRVPDTATGFSLPLLNLDGPPGLGDKPDLSSEFNNTKKKRKRRKKKKTRVLTSSADTH